MTSTPETFSLSAHCARRSGTTPAGTVTVEVVVSISVPVEAWGRIYALSDEDVAGDLGSYLDHSLVAALEAGLPSIDEAGGTITSCSV